MLCLVAWVHQAADQYFFCGFGSDKTAQVAAALSLTDGNGLSVVRADPANPAVVHRVALFGWPPGYSLAVGVPLAAGMDPFWSCLVVDWLASAVFFASWLAITEMVVPSIGRTATVAFWIYWAVAFPPLAETTSSDVLAAACYSVSTALALKAVVTASSAGGLILSAAAGLGAAAAAAVRFAYLPLAAVLPCATWIAHGAPRGRATARAAACAVASAAVATAIYVWQISSTGEATYLDRLHPPDERGWYVRQLASFVPFGAGAIGWHPAADRAMARLRLPAAAAVVASWLVTVLAGAVLAILALAAARPAHDDRSRRAAACTWLVGFLTLGLTAAMVAWCTLRFREIHGWVYAQEQRYFAPAYGFVLLGLAAAAVGIRVPSSTGRKWLAVAALGVLLSALVLSGTQRARKWWRYACGTWPQEPNSARFDADGRLVQSLVDERRSQGWEVVYVDSVWPRRGVAAMQGAATLERIEGPLPRQRRARVVLMVALGEDDAVVSESDRHALRRRGTRLAVVGAAEIWEIEL